MRRSSAEGTNDGRVRPRNDVRARSSPMRPAASAPASTAARTLLTSPRTITLTTPPSSLITVLATSTLAALSIASTALINPTRPSVSTRPKAFPFMIVSSPRAIALGWFVSAPSGPVDFKIPGTCAVTDSSGRGMTWALTSSPTLPAASAPASTAARTLPTSPFTRVVTYAAADLHSAGKLHVGRLEHGVGRLDHADQALGLDQPQGIAVAGTAVAADRWLVVR